MLATPELEIARELPPEDCSAAEAERYTRRLATHHYENFNVVSWLLPRRLHQHFYNVYAYCRWSDDLGDEVPDRDRALELLDAWEKELQRIYAPGSAPNHPVLIALRETIRAKQIPIEPFRNLLRAFRQDQVVQRYRTWDELLDYCEYSANPVGRIVLYLCDYRDAERQKLSDFTCTALQLANFWQDVSRDLEKGRIYIPLEALAAHGLVEAEILGRKFSDRYIALMKDLIARTRAIFAAGLPLAKTVDPFLRVDIELFSRGGIAILDAIESQGYNTLEQRPVLTKRMRIGLLGRALASMAFSRGIMPPAEVASARPSKAHLVSGSAIDAPKKPTSLYSTDVRESYAECTRIARAAKSSFFMAFYGLPRQKRNALCALYAFMRLVDNASDEPAGVDAKRRGLAKWRALLDEAVAGRTDGHKILPALADTLERFDIPPRYLHDLILGAEMDLTISRYPSFDRLSEYCYRVAGTVGLCCIHVFGFRDSRAPDLAERLGMAFQLTNIIRDVRSDFEMGRVYIPEDDLRRFSLPESELAGPHSSRLRGLLEFEAERAWQFYEQGAPLLKLIDADSRKTLWALIRTYSALLARIEAADFDVFPSRISVSGGEKVRILFAAGMAGWWKKDALAKRFGNRRRIGGPLLRSSAG
jgi:squalene synthase HpnC